jgi:hypothetical protein
MATELMNTSVAVDQPGGDLARFLFTPASPRPLAVFRVGLASVLLVQAFTLMESLLSLFGNQGIVQWSVSALLVRPELPHLSWLASALAPLGVSADACLRGVFMVYVAALAGLLLGWQTRASAIVAWFTHLLLMTTGTTSVYGVDTFAQIALFYCMWMPVGQSLAVDRWGQPDAASAAARLSLRVLQLHLCIVYFSSGLDKAEGMQWWTGDAIWRGLMRPDFNQFDVTWLASVPWLAMLICWGTLLVELGYAFCVWPKRTRALWALATIGLHLGIAVLMGLWSFSALMIVLTGSTFLVSAEPRSRHRRWRAERVNAPSSLSQGVHTPRSSLCA